MARIGAAMVLAAVMSLGCMASVLAADLAEVRQRGVLRHLGVPYANFVSGSGDGLDVDLIRGFAASLGVRYEYVPADWDTIAQDLLGTRLKVTGSAVKLLEATPVRGDLIANGFTILPWREKVFMFSEPVFPSQIWLVALAESKVRPIKPTGSVDRDIAVTKGLMKGKSVLALEKTCLDPALYKLSETGARVVCFKGKLNELAPALLKKEAEMTILDFPDALIALEKWPGRFKVVGPISRKQMMGVAFPMDAVKLHAAFNRFLDKSKRDGSYLKIVKRYYPSSVRYFPDFFTGNDHRPQ
ncbi:transporter substrate-binding domain-containing protein [Geobacter sp. FeAm09]|uniref:transporter substrate-binding domain-containing protein n=1 Tax=Geobacter sp. FeAm09 TaxID=2597769 RepID=UPI0011EF93D9|nr:transporter substrate-binding domain-containing protein [Geobacter sp. FeAm09]QEM69623.1 transporter substrate-binding domain-containing protein [Geobacter sp. FeAm09]